MIIGVMGQIASGKSEVLKIFRKKGFFCIDADEIVYDLYKANGEGSKRIAVVFGEKFLSPRGAVNRVMLRNEVFADENKLKLLNNVIHPIVFEEIVKLLRENHENVAIEAIYFDQSFLNDFVDKLIWIERLPELIKKVLISERNFSSAIANFAAKLITRPNNVDLVINNNGSLSDLKRLVEESFFV